MTRTLKTDHLSMLKESGHVDMALFIILITFLISENRYKARINVNFVTITYFVNLHKPNAYWCLLLPKNIKTKPFTKYRIYVLTPKAREIIQP